MARTVSRREFLKGVPSFETGAETGTLFYSRRIGLADGLMPWE